MRSQQFRCPGCGYPDFYSVDSDDKECRFCTSVFVLNVEIPHQKFKPQTKHLVISPETQRNLQLSLLASLLLCEHQGDVMDVLFDYTGQYLGFEVPEGEASFSDRLRDELDRLGIKTLNGTELRHG